MHLLKSGLIALLLAAPAWAQQAPFGTPWSLDESASSLRFTSVKKGSVVETSSFATLTGGIKEGGAAEVRILLDSVDTGIDLRNVRMRFLFFETFKHPEAVISLQIPDDAVADLATVRRKVVQLPYRISLHGVSRDLVADVAVTLLADDIVAVASAAPINLGTAEFELEDGRQKLEEAAGVTIVPNATVTFDFLFRREAAGVDVASRAPAQPETVALETEGDFSREECAGRFEILSRTGNIYFATASARLTPESTAVLDSIADIINRCPGLVIEVAGHTDSDGSETTNLRLSESRARSVSEYFTRAGIPAESLRTVGYGEARPAFPNTNRENKRRNRRIEFSVIQ
ncbi:MAG: OmpA family protein [Pseudomonadota bacterium]